MTEAFHFRHDFRRLGEENQATTRHPTSVCPKTSHTLLPNLHLPFGLCVPEVQISGPLGHVSRNRIVDHFTPDCLSIICLSS
jgi:hypothetical protein